MKVFVPLSDDLLDNPPDELLDPLNREAALVPYQLGRLSISQVTAPTATEPHSKSSNSSSPGFVPSSAALPAFSSSTYLAGPALGKLGH